MDNLIDISFIIPCHNLENYIKPLLLSLCALNLDGIKSEFIFILDDCTDNTKDQIIKYMPYYYDYKILYCNHHSCGLARNEGLDIACGEFIWFLDGDDWIIYPNVLQDVLPILRKQKLKFIRLKYISNFFTLDYYSMVWQYIYRRDFIGDIRFLSIQPQEDNKFQDTLEISKEQIYQYTIPTYFYNYNRPSSNMSQFREKGKIDP